MIDRDLCARVFERALFVLALFLFAGAVQAQTTFAWTGAVDNKWSTAGNWNPPAVPVSGSSLVFPGVASNRANTNDLAAGTSFVNITISGSNYILSGNPIVLTGQLRKESNGSANQFGLGIDVGTNPLTLASDYPALRVTSALTGSAPITLAPIGSSCGYHEVAASGSYSGAFSTSGSVCGVQITSANLPFASFNIGAELFGQGTLGALTSSSNFYVGYNLYSSGDATGILATGNLALTGGGQLRMSASGPTAGTGHDQIQVTGTVNLGTNKQLILSVAPSYVPAVGQQLMLIQNDGTDPVVGTFTGLPQGAFINVLGSAFQISYSGGTGNDVVLTVTSEPKVWNGSVSNLWSDSANWTPAGIPVMGDALLFTDTATRKSPVNDLPGGLELSRIAISGNNYTLTGNEITLTAQLRKENGGSNNIVNLGINVGTNAVTIASDYPGIRIAGTLSGTGPITLGATSSSCGFHDIRASGSYSGTISTGASICVTQVSGANLPNATMNVGTEAFLQGTLGSTTVSSTLSVGYDYYGIGDTVGLLTTRNLALLSVGAQVRFTVNNTIPGTGHDQIVVNGTAEIGTNRPLILTFGSGFVPTVGQQLVLVANDGTDAIVGTFSGLPQGAILSAAGAEFQIDYGGGSGNDIVLTVTSVPKVWNGSVSNLWSNPANWTPAAAPVTGDSLLFPNGPTRRSPVNDLSAGLSLAKIVVSGSNYTIGGNGVVLTNQVRQDVGGNNNRLDLGLDVGASGAAIYSDSQGLRIGGTLTGTGPVTLRPASSCGYHDLAVNGSYSGTISTLSACILQISDANIPDAIVSATTSLYGQGTLGNLSATSSIYPGYGVWTTGDTTGILNTRNLALTGGGQVGMTVNGITPGASHDQFNAQGTVALGTFKSLAFTFSNTLIPSLGQQIVLINNDGTDPVTGTFSGLPEGSTLLLGGFTFRLSYSGGTGNDVTLTSLNGRILSSTTLVSSLNPANAGQSVTFTATVTGSSGTPTGNVVFRDGTTIIGTVLLNGSGVATLSTSTLPNGNRAISAEYVGDVTYGSSSATLNQVIVPMYTLTYLVGTGGSLSGATPQSVPQGGSGSAVTATPLTGYSFVQWSDGRTDNPRTDSNVTANLTVTAVFDANAYTVSFDSQGGSTVASITQDFGTTVTVPAAPTRTGYSFVAWNTQADGLGTAYAPGATFPMPALNQTLYAIWSNTTPSLMAIPALMLNEDGTAEVLLQIADAESLAASLLVTAQSDNTALLPHPAVTTLADPQQRRLLVAPNDDANGGPTLVEVTVTDEAGLSIARSFPVTVRPVNDAPTFGTSGDRTEPAGAQGLRTVPGFIQGASTGPENESDQFILGYSVTQVSDPANAVSAIAVAVDGTLSYTLTGTGGVATFEIRASDSGGTANGGQPTSDPVSLRIEVASGTDLQISVSNGRTTWMPGDWVIYDIFVANAGPSDVGAARVESAIPGELIGAAWTCSVILHGVCPATAGVGSIDQIVGLEAGGVIRFSLMAQVASATADGVLVLTATVSPPAGMVELVPLDNIDSDSDLILIDGLFQDGFEDGANRIMMPVDSLP